MIYQQHTLGGDIVAIDDANSDRFLWRINIGDGYIPDSVALSAHHAVLYANFANRWDFWQNPTKEARSCFAAFDAHSGAELWRVPLLGFAEHFAHTADRRHFYVAHADRKLLSRVDTVTREVLPIRIANMGGHKVRVSPDDCKVYVGSITWGSLDEVDCARARWTRQLTFEHNVRPFVVTPDGATLYVQLSHLHGFHVVDAASLRSTGVVKLPPIPEGCLAVEPHYPFTTDHGIEVAPAHDLMIICATTAHQVVFYRLSTLELLGVLNVGEQPSYVTVAKTRPLAYVSCRASNELVVIDLESRQIHRRIAQTGAYPQRVVCDH
jgi:DNA-binding beta-propeller fold protein YncE